MPASVEERLVLRAVAALVAFVLSTGVALALTHDEDGDVALLGDPTTGSVVAGQLLPGTSVKEYAADRASALEALRSGAVAVVSFEDYRTEGDGRDLVRPLEVEALLVAAPGGQGEVTDGPVQTWVDAAVHAATTERAALLDLANSSTDPAFTAQFKADVSRLDSLTRLIRSTPNLVYGAVVRGPADALRLVATRPGVRIVAPAARDLPDDIATLGGGVRPEEIDRVGTPSARPLP